MSLLVLHALLLAVVDRTGDCICDLTSLLCDANCCCDPDCQEATVQYAFTHCKKEKYGSRKGVRCTEPPVSVLEPFWINPRGSLDGVYNSEEEYYSRVLKTQSTEAERSQMCIVHDRLGLDDDSYDLSPLTDQELIALNSNRELWNFRRGPITTWVPKDAPGVNQLPGDWYRAGDRVMAQQGDGVQFYLTIPTDIGQTCNDLTPAYFLTNVLSGNTCTRSGNLQDLCSGALNAEMWNILLSGQRTVTYVNGPPPTVFDAGVCRKAALRVDIEVVYQLVATNGIATAQISAFRVSITLGDVTTVPVVQQHTIKWLNVDDTMTTVTPSQWSGNPGYRRGTSISVRQNAVISAFSLPFGYDCSSVEQNEVKFLFNVVTAGCSFEMDLNQYNTMCQGSTTNAEVLIAGFLPDMLTAPTEFAVYGNSESDVPADWTNLVTTTPQNGNPTELVTHRRCRFLVGYDYTFVLRRMGRVYNPQDYIAGVLKSPVYSDFTFTNRVAGARQRFALRWRASFIREGSANIKSDAIEAPPLLPVVSDDIFYPFHIDRRPTPVEDTEL